MRIGGEGLLEARQRFVVALEVMQRRATAVERLRIIGLGGQRSVVARQRLLVALEADEHFAALDQRLDVIRLELQSLPEAYAATPRDGRAP